MTALEVASVTVWLKKFNFWMSEFSVCMTMGKSAWPNGCHYQTQRNEVSLYRQTYTSPLSCDNKMNVKLGGINDLQKTYRSEWYRPLTQPFPQASMINNHICDMELWFGAKCNWIIWTLVQVGDCWKYALEANNKVCLFAYFISS